MLTDANNDAWPAQFVLGAFSLCSLILLGDRPLLNPLQAFVLLFHWWYCWGPAICSAFYYLSGDPGEAQPFLENHSGAVWVVAIGLPIYAICVRLTLRFARYSNMGLRFLLPSGLLYNSKTLLAYAGISSGVYALMTILGLFGMRAYQNTDYLGGQVTESPILAALDSVKGLGQFAIVGLLGYLAAPNRTNWKPLRLAIVLMTLANIGIAFQSGAKGPIVLPLFFLILLFFTYRQRLPWALVLSLLASYLIIVEPFVASSRGRAQQEQLTTSDQRTKLFREQLRNFELASPDWRAINVESPFRGVYSRSVKVAQISSFSHGPWEGQSLRDGFSAMVPRFIDPNKADSNMGNYFAHQLDESSIENTMNNIAITIPFEIVGNYGFAAGILSFGVIGVFWTLLVSFLLSEERLATHPLMPLCVSMMMAMEGSVGQFVNSLKPLPFALAGAWFVWFALRHSKPAPARTIATA
jgi:hypothetical protein